MSVEEDIGYIKGILERNTLDTQDVKGKLTEYMDKQDTQMKEIKEDLRKLEDRLNVYKHFIFFIKALGWTSLLILTFKWGDISELWEKK